jgi:hypothetical protein
MFFNSLAKMSRENYHLRFAEKKNRLSNIPIPTKTAKVKGIIIDTYYRTEHKDIM